MSQLIAAAWPMMVLPHTGILALGAFVGFVIGWCLLSSNQGIKAAVTGIGAAVGGGPILFMGDVGQAKWMYPIGLVIGLLWVSMRSAPAGVAQGQPAKRVLAWLHITIIVIFTFGAAAYAIVAN